MTNLTIFAGFDVSKRFFDVCFSINGQEHIKHFIYDSPGLADLIEWLPQQCHCVMEATGAYHLKLACHLYEHGFTVSVVNPLVIRRFAQMRLSRAKTDKADARMIAAYGITEHPPAWQPPAAYMIKLQQLEALLQQMHKQRAALVCQSEAFSATAMMDREIKDFLDSAIAYLDSQIEQLNKRMEAIIKAHHQQMLSNIISIPGVGKKTAIVLMVLSDCFKKFSNYKQLIAYLGLSPRIYQSGTSVKGKASICKMGMSRARAMLYVCAWSAKRCNKGCKELYDRLVSKGKAKRLALIAVANKLVKQAFAIATTNSIYQPNYSKNICL